MRVLFAESADLADAVLVEWTDGLWPQKRTRVEHLRFQKDKRLVLTAHRLLCYALKDEFGIAPLAGDWGIGEYGKPYLKNEGVHFNISHSGNMAMCAIHTKPVGTDIERIRPVGSGLAERIMSEEEQKAYGRVLDKERLFYRIWTLKEAFIKYKGLRILDHLDELTVYPEGDRIRSNVPGCRFALIDHVPGYQAAVCASELDGFSTERIGMESLIKL